MSQIHRQGQNPERRTVSTDSPPRVHDSGWFTYYCRRGHEDASRLVHPSGLLPFSWLLLLMLGLLLLRADVSLSYHSWGFGCESQVWNHLVLVWPPPQPGLTPWHSSLPSGCPWSRCLTPTGGSQVTWRPVLAALGTNLVQGHGPRRWTALPVWTVRRKCVCPFGLNLVSSPLTLASSQFCCNGMQEFFKITVLCKAPHEKPQDLWGKWN